MIKKLPDWVLTGTYPAFYDHESLTVIQQTARLWAKVQELIEAYNEYVNTIDTKIAEQDGKIDDAVAYMKDNLEQIVTELFREAIYNHEIQVDFKLTYDAETEELTFGIESSYIEDGDTEVY